MTLYPAKPKCQAGSHVLTEKYHNPNLATCDPRSGTIVAKLPIADAHPHTTTYTPPPPDPPAPAASSAPPAPHACGGSRATPPAASCATKREETAHNNIINCFIIHSSLLSFYDFVLISWYYSYKILLFVM